MKYKIGDYVKLKSTGIRCHIIDIEGDMYVLDNQFKVAESEIVKLRQRVTAYKNRYLADYKEGEDYIVLKKYKTNIDIYMKKTCRVVLGVAEDTVLLKAPKIPYSYYLLAPKDFLDAIRESGSLDYSKLDIPKCRTDSKVGEIRMQHNLCWARLEKDTTVSSDKVTVTIFSPDISLKPKVLKVSYTDFNNGNLNYPDFKTSARSSSRRGEVSRDIEGYPIVLTKFQGMHNITVSYKGSKVNTTYDCFKSGTIVNNPKPDNHTVDIGKDGEVVEDNKRDEIIAPNWQLRGKHIGESIIALNGMRMTIERWASPYDIDVRFADDHVGYNKDYYSFLRGKVVNPKYRTKYDDDFCQDPLYLYKRLKGVTEDTELVNSQLMLSSDLRCPLNINHMVYVKDLLGKTDEELKSITKTGHQYRELWALKRACNVIFSEN